MGETTKMTDYADLIKQSVPMDAVLRRYGLMSQNIRHRIPCPLHGGQKNNFSFHGHVYKCFVCGASGSTIDFVMQFRNLPFQDAMKEINDDFGLGFPIGERERTEEDEAARKKAEQLRRKRIERENRLKQLCTVYDAAMDKYAALDLIIQHDTPQGPYDEISERYTYALKHIDAAWDEVQEAAEAIRFFAKEGDSD